MQFPLLARFIEYLWDQGFDKQLDWEKIPAQPKLLKYFASVSKIVINFKNKKMSALLKDQFQEIIPEFEVVLDKVQPEATDILVCDTDILQGYMDKRTVSARRIFLYLENRMDYTPFRALNAKAFMRPISGYRIIKLILQDIYL